MSDVNSTSAPRTIGSVSVPQYPCDKGQPGNVLDRGYHHFESSPNGVIVCRYCGKKADRG